MVVDGDTWGSAEVHLGLSLRLTPVPVPEHRGPRRLQPSTRLTPLEEVVLDVFVWLLELEHRYPISYVVSKQWWWKLSCVKGKNLRVRDGVHINFQDSCIILLHKQIQRSVFLISVNSYDGKGPRRWVE